MNTCKLPAILLCAAAIMGACSHNQATTTANTADTIAATGTDIALTMEDMEEQRLNALIGRCAAIYICSTPDSIRYDMTHYSLIDIDGDTINELCLATNDKRFCAVFTTKDEPKLVCAETNTATAKFYVGRIRMSEPVGRSGFKYTNYIIANSRLAHTFSKTEVYGEMRESHLDKRRLTYDECLDYQEKLSRQEISPTAFGWTAIP